MIATNKLILLAVLLGCFVGFATFCVVKVSRSNGSLVEVMSDLVNNQKSRFFGVWNRTDTIQVLQKQRDDLSNMMNSLSQAFHQYQCEVAKTGISGHGGWCPKDASEDSGQHVTDQALVSMLNDILQGETVASFGDGPGAYKRLIDKAGRIGLYDAFDGAPFCENTTKGLVSYLDLTVPIYGMQLYDWILSLEVGEHIPKQFEQTFLDNIARHAGKGIILSWAVPGQPGNGHINCNSLDYIVSQLDQRGFYHDLNMSHKLQNGSSIPWIKKNINVYHRKSASHPDILML